MPILHKCRYCGKSIPVGQHCECQKKEHANDKYVYSSQKIKHTQHTYSDSFYHSKDWRRLRLVAMALYKNTDIYSWYKYGILEAGFTVHHIIPLKDDYDRRTDINNLIYLTEENHRAIHALMDESDEKKAEIQQELFDMIEKWKREGFGI